MINKTVHLLFTLLFVGLTLTQISNAQDWDYEEYPHLPYQFDHLDAEITLSETGSVEGDLLYLIRFKDSGLDSLVFDAPNMEINSIAVNDGNSEFYLDGDKLVIYLDGDFQRREQISLRIQYRTQPRFGYFQTAKGTFFTSNLPGATSHWLPVADHPRVQFTTELIFTHPAGKRVISTGRMSRSDVAGISEEITTYSSNKPVSPVNLNFVMGNLELAASSLNETPPGNQRALFEGRSDNQIHIYSEVSDLNARELLNDAMESYAELFNFFGIGYPYRDLSVVVLEDDFWETKPYGAGVIYLFENRGSLHEQLQKALIGQWLGAHIREEQWSDADAILALQAWTANELFELEYELDESAQPYHVFAGHLLSRWQNYFKNDPDSKFTIHFGRVFDQVITEQSHLLTWEKLARMIYNETGYPYFEKFDPGEITIEEEEHFPYTAEMTWNEGESNISISFNALDQPVNELVTVRVDEVTFSETREHELTFTGSSDTIVLNVSNNTENIRLTVTGRDDVNLEIDKPFEFWIYQLRNAEDPVLRKDAAEGLANYSDNPDLQLALKDQMRQEEHPAVYAELLRTLSNVTRGASGTDQTYLDHLSNNYSEEIRRAAVEGMAYFKDNDRIISRLRSIANQAGSAQIRRSAIRSLYEVTGSRQFKNITEDLITSESNLLEVPMMLTLLVRKGEEEAAVQFSSTFLADGFPYSVRSEILELILQVDQSLEGWENRLPTLMADRDPRIRVKSLEALDRIDSTLRRELIEARQVEENDERIRRVLQEL